MCVCVLLFCCLVVLCLCCFSAFRLCFARGFCLGWQPLLIQFQFRYREEHSLFAPGSVFKLVVKKRGSGAILGQVLGLARGGYILDLQQVILSPEAP